MWIHDSECEENSEACGCRSRNELRAEIEALRTDAERYRWLRSNAMDLVVDVPSGGWFPEGEELDAAVDAGRIR